MSRKKKRRHPTKKERAYEQYLASFPEWYWVHGLHDAQILSISTEENGHLWQHKRPFHNCLVLELNSASAIYDNTVRTLVFYNYTYLTPDVDIHVLDNAWWLRDRLKQLGDNRWHLELVVEPADVGNRTIEFVFEFAKIVRK